METLSAPIAILTHGFNGNYGGMLQAYALQRALASCGIAANLADYNSRHLFRMKHSLASLLKLRVREFQNYFGFSSIRTPIPWSQMQRISVEFRDKYIPCTFAESPDVFASVNKHVRTWVVGSDQVWRGCMGGMLNGTQNFFLAFASRETRQRSISYAASFGSDEWECNEATTAQCRELVRDFKAVSVRELSGVDICRKYLDVEAVQMPDPTLIAAKDDYLLIANNFAPEKTCKEEYIACYMLDRNKQKLELLAQIAEKMGMPIRHLQAHSSEKSRKGRTLLSVEEWVHTLCHSKYVVTDSFHGCVFSIIFNKPFLCLGNEARGSARFDSLFKTMNIPRRLLLGYNADEAVQILETPIDWAVVNEKHESERQRGLQFLKANLLTV